MASKIQIETEAKLLIECYSNLNLTFEDAKKLAKLDDDFQSEVLEYMQEYSVDVKRAIRALS